jgi:DNA-binding CsgD family transcriptional regulator
VPAADVARSLNLSTKTVANHLSAARQKLGAQNDFQLMGKLSQLGLLDESTSP